MTPLLQLPPGITDVHTHNPANAPHAIVSRRFPQEKLLADAPWQSIGIHPWDAAEEVDWDAFLVTASDPRVVAIGEAGLDMLRGSAQDIQEKVFIAQAEIAERLKKPLILHVVKAFHHILALKHRIRPGMPWIVHGFRGKSELARQLTDAGMYLSVGDKFNPDIFQAVPPQLILRETD